GSSNTAEAPAVFMQLHDQFIRHLKRFQVKPFASCNCSRSKAQFPKAFSNAAMLAAVGSTVRLKAKLILSPTRAYLSWPDPVPVFSCSQKWDARLAPISGLDLWYLLKTHWPFFSCLKPDKLITSKLSEIELAASVARLLPQEKRSKPPGKS